MQQEKEQKKAYAELPIHHKRVYSLLRQGVENSITCNDISKITNISTKDIRLFINQLITRYGYVIGASNSFKGKRGFYIPTGQDEERDALMNLRSRRIKIQEREQALINNIANRYLEDK